MTNAASWLEARRVARLRSTFGFALVAACSIFAAPQSVFACACCSNDGQRFVETQTIDTYTAGVLADVGFAEAAHLYTGEADVGGLGVLLANRRIFVLALRRRTHWVGFLDFSEAGVGGI